MCALTFRNRRKMESMARAVKITTHALTLDEFGDRLGLSKARRKTLNPIFVERRAQGDYAVRRSDSGRASHVFPTQRQAVERARELSPDRRVFVERVRDTPVGSRDRWRKG